VKKPTTAARKRVNITLSGETLRLLDRVAPKGARSRLIDEAVQSYVASKRRSSLRWLLREGSQARSGRDLALADEWAALDDETWQPPRRKK
jgi:CopG family transcriptional regulator / antitoxin EndoAI